jgi:WD40 repeat protein
MVRLRLHPALILLAVLVLGRAAPAAATEPAKAATGLYDRPVLVFDPGMHTAPINRADVDADGRFAVTGSNDRTVRIWSVADGRLLRTIRLPVGPGDVGKVYAVAISPDGALVAAGGWTGPTGGNDNIYLFDRETGALDKRIGGLADVVLHLVFSPDGRNLAATLFGGRGLRVYDRVTDWAEIARDTNYGAASYGAAFARDGRLATTSIDGHVRLYDRAFRRIAKREVPGGSTPFALAFSPDGKTLAVGSHDSTVINRFDGQTLEPLSGPDTDGIAIGNLMIVEWSTDGETLFAGGMYDRGDGVNPVVAWNNAGLGARRELPAGYNTIMTLRALADGGELVGTGDPYLAVLDPEGGERWAHRSPLVDFRNQDKSLAVSADGTVVDFGYEGWGKVPARFDLRSLGLTREPPHDGRTAPPDHGGIPEGDWKNTTRPMLNGKPLRLKPYEPSRSLAVHPEGERTVLGAEWYLRAYDGDGELLWSRAVPGVVWAVNITGDGRLVVAAHGDGTIRWHRMDDGRELLAFLPLADRKNWVAWTPEGFYGATPGAHGVLRWHVNRGWDAPGEAVPVSDIPELRRPGILPLVLQEMETARAIGVYEIVKAREAVKRQTGSSVAPGARLHVLAVGVSDYGEQARHLRLDFADQDAQDVASALVNTQGSLYADVVAQTLRNDEATTPGIFDALATMRAGMAGGEGRDLAVVMFSGHGAMVDGKFYLLTYGVDARTAARIKASALSIADFRDELRALGHYGRVLVLLDACRSGAATADGASLPLNAEVLRAALAGANVTVLTSSSGGEASREDARWNNGAFTEVLLDALGSAADTDRNGLVSITELTEYLTTRVPQLTGQAQNPGIEVRFESDVFVAGL